MSVCSLLSSVVVVFFCFFVLLPPFSFLSSFAFLSSSVQSYTPNRSTVFLFLGGLFRVGIPLRVPGPCGLSKLVASSCVAGWPLLVCVVCGSVLLPPALSSVMFLPAGVVFIVVASGAVTAALPSRVSPALSSVLCVLDVLDM